MKRVFIRAMVLLLVICLFSIAGICESGICTEEDAVNIAKQYFRSKSALAEEMMLNHFLVSVDSFPEENDQSIIAGYTVSFTYSDPLIDPKYQGAELTHPVFRVIIEKATGRIETENMRSPEAFLMDIRAYYYHQLYYAYIAKVIELHYAAYGSPWIFWPYDVKADFCEKYQAMPTGYLEFPDLPVSLCLYPSGDGIQYDEAMDIIDRTLIEHDIHDDLSSYLVDARYRNVQCSYNSSEKCKGWLIMFFSPSESEGYDRKYACEICAEHGLIYLCYANHHVDQYGNDDPQGEERFKDIFNIYAKQ